MPKRKVVPFPDDFLEPEPLADWLELVRYMRLTKMQASGICSESLTD